MNIQTVTAGHELEALFLAHLCSTFVVKMSPGKGDEGP